MGTAAPQRGPLVVIVKRRTVEIHPRGTISQVRRVQKFSKWSTVAYCTNAEQAEAWISDARTRGGLFDYAIFQRGRRLAPREEPR